MRGLAMLGLVASVSVTVDASAAPAEAAAKSGGGWLSTRLSLDARFTNYWLEETRRSGEHGYDNGNLSGNFLGSLWSLDAQQHYLPNPYLEYRGLRTIDFLMQSMLRGGWELDPAGASLQGCSCGCLPVEPNCRKQHPVLEPESRWGPDVARRRAGELLEAGGGIRRVRHRVPCGAAPCLSGAGARLGFNGRGQGAPR